MNIWRKISNFGIDTKMSNLQQRQVVLTNQISVILGFIVFVIMLLLLIKLQVYANAIIMFFAIIILFSTPFINRMGFTNISKLIVSIVIPLFVTVASTYGKIVSEEARDIVFYLAPRIFIIASLVVPLVLIDYRNKTYFFSALAIYFITLVVYSKIQTLAGVGIEHANINPKMYFLATSISIFAFLVLVVSFIFLQKQNIKYELDLQQQNITLKEQKLKIANAFEELQASEEELRQNTEELHTLNENLREINVLILEKNTSLEHKNNEIEEQAQLIKSSINYAKNIQNAILPNWDAISTVFENFIIYKPKDIVSGDFIWYFYNKTENSNYLSVVDCTGHGIPGAFLSIVSSRLLHKIIVEYNILNPNDILTTLHIELCKALKQSESKNNDGLDISFCKINKTLDGVKIEFSGAKLPVYYYKKTEKEIVRIKGNAKHIGGIKTSKSKENFTVKAFSLQKADMLYLATDGFIDQNNVERKRFGTNHFLRTLTEIAEEPLKEQKDILENKLTNWQKDCLQRDDITLIGLKI